MPVNIDEALEITGGFGYFQILATICFMITRNSGMALYYGFGWLVLQQSYICRNDPLSDFESCTTDYICDDTTVKPVGFEFS